MTAGENKEGEWLVFDKLFNNGVLNCATLLLFIPLSWCKEISSTDVKPLMDKSSPFLNFSFTSPKPITQWTIVLR